MSRRGSSTARLLWALVAMIAVFMTGTVVVALGQEDIGWGWWWAVPVGGLFLMGIIGFRVLVQRSQEGAERGDARGPGDHH